MMKKRIVGIVSLLFILVCAGCETVPAQKEPSLVDENTYSTLSEEEIEKLREKVGASNKTRSTTAVTQNNDLSVSADSVSTKSFMTGVWLARTNDGEERYFIFTDAQNGVYLEQETGMGMGFTYEMQGDESAVFHFGDTESNDIAFISWIDNSNAYVSWQAGEIETFTVVTGNPSPDYHFYNNNQLGEMAINYYQSKNGTRPQKAFAMVDASENIFIQVYDEQNGTQIVLESYVVDRYTAIGVDSLNQVVDLKTAPATPVSSDSSTTNTTAVTTTTTTTTTATTTTTPPVTTPEPVVEEIPPVEEVPPEEPQPQEAPPEEPQPQPQEAPPEEHQPQPQEAPPEETQPQEEPQPEQVPQEETPPEEIPAE